MRLLDAYGEAVLGIMEKAEAVAPSPKMKALLFFKKWRRGERGCVFFTWKVFCIFTLFYDSEQTLFKMK